LIAWRSIDNAIALSTASRRLNKQQDALRNSLRENEQKLAIVQPIASQKIQASTPK
jgi:hypothetical protein